MSRKQTSPGKLVAEWVRRTNHLHAFEQSVLELEHNLVQALQEQTLPADQQSLADRFGLDVAENGRLQIQLGKEIATE